MVNEGSLGKRTHTINMGGQPKGPTTHDNHQRELSVLRRRSIAMVTEPDNSTQEYHVWRAGQRRKCLVNISTSALDQVIQVSHLKIINVSRLEGPQPSRGLCQSFPKPPSNQFRGQIP